MEQPGNPGVRVPHSPGPDQHSVQIAEHALNRRIRREYRTLTTQQAANSLIRVSTGEAQHAEGTLVLHRHHAAGDVEICRMVSAMPEQARAALLALILSLLRQKNP